MNKLKQKIAALLTVGIGIVPNVPFNVVKANNILQEGAFVENFQKKNITVYKTNDNLLVDANLNYINGEGKPLGKDDEKVSVSNELKDKIKLHPVLEYINTYGDRYQITKLQFNDRYAQIFVKTAKKDAEFKMLRFNSKTSEVICTKIINKIIEQDFIEEFGEALPKKVNEISDSEACNLTIDLKCEARSIKAKNNELDTSGEDKQEVLNILVASIVGTGVLYWIYNTFLN